jgi:hypothetical protein
MSLLKIIRYRTAPTSTAAATPRNTNQPSPTKTFEPAPVSVGLALAIASSPLPAPVCDEGKAESVLVDPIAFNGYPKSHVSRKVELGDPVGAGDAAFSSLHVVVRITTSPVVDYAVIVSVLYGLFPTVRRAFSVSDVTVQTAVHSVSCVHAIVMSL